MASGLLLLLDDITSVLDDVATLTKVAVQKTSGVLGDDLALNAQQVTGVQANRELPIVWAVAKGSAVNKAILIPAAVCLSVVAPWAITPLLIIGGAFLCYEGFEKVVHKLLHSKHEDQQHEMEHKAAISTPAIDVVALEKSKIRGAVRTDFILSAEIIVISLGVVEQESFLTKLVVLLAIGVLMTIGVYGLVAGIVKLDDFGTWLTRYSGMRKRVGRGILYAAPYLMKFLSVAGTAAMFLVGGGILVHKIGFIHHLSESLIKRVAVIPSFVTETLINFVVGIICGALVVLVVQLINVVRSRGRSPEHTP